MKTSMIRLGIGSIVLAGILVACVSSLTGTNEAHAAATPQWHRIDKAELFLHDLTAAPATLAAAMKARTDGTVTGNIASLYELKFWRSPQGVVAARSADAVPFDSEGDGIVFFNVSAEPVMAYFQVGAVLVETLLLHGEGVAVGEMSALLQTETQRGCKCVCSATHPSGDPVEDAQYIPCSQVVPDYEQGTQCDCSTVNGDFCWFPPPVHPDMDGQYRDCKGGWIPVNPGSGA